MQLATFLKKIYHSIHLNCMTTKMYIILDTCFVVQGINIFMILLWTLPIIPNWERIQFTPALQGPAYPFI